MSGVTHEKFAHPVVGRPFRNGTRGALTAEAEIVHRCRTTLVVEVMILDKQLQLIAKLVATLLAPAAPPATAPAGRPGR